MSHSPEPWKVHNLLKNYVFVLDANNKEIVHETGRIEDGWTFDLADAERIVACVNFCRDIPTEWMQGKIAKTVQVSPNERPEDGWRHLALTPNLLGLIPVCKEPPHP